MSKTIIQNPNVFKNMIGNFLGYSQWKLITQKEIDTFAQATEDYQWIHVDTAKSIKVSPYKSTIAHGYYSLSLIPKFVYQSKQCLNLQHNFRFRYY